VNADLNWRLPGLTQALSETLLAGQTYTLTTAIGRFLPGQPYSPSSFGGYVIQLLAGTTVIAEDADTVDPPAGEFLDAVAVVDSDALDPALLGQALSIRLTISSTDAPRSTHFDDVRLVRIPHASVPLLSVPGAAWLALAMLASVIAFARRRVSA